MRLLILVLTLGVILVPDDAAARRPWFRRYRAARECTSRADSVERMKSAPWIDLDGDGIADDPKSPSGNPSSWDLNGDGIPDVPGVAYREPVKGFATPAQAYEAFRHAYNSEDWAAQFACITPSNRSEFVFDRVYQSLFLLREPAVASNLRSTLTKHGLPPEKLKRLWHLDGNNAAASRDKAQQVWQQNVYPTVTEPQALLGKLRHCVAQVLADQESGLQEGHLFYRRHNYTNWLQWRTCGNAGTVLAARQHKNGGLECFPSVVPLDYWNSLIDIEGDGIGDVPSPVSVTVHEPGEEAKSGDINDDEIDDTEGSRYVDPEAPTNIELRRHEGRWYVTQEAFWMLP